MTQVLDAPNGTLATMEPSQRDIQHAQAQAVDAPKANPRVGNRGIEIGNFNDLWRLASAIAASPFAPKGIETPQAIFVAIQLGLEVGMTPMASMQSIAVVNGRPSIYGDAALALVRSSGLCDYYLEFPSDNTVHALAEQLAVALEFEDRDETKRLRLQIAAATAKIDRSSEGFGYTSISRRKGAVTSIVRRFTISDAARAGLKGKAGPWTQYTERMLMWRSRGFNLRDNFGDVLKGMYTTEEARDLPPLDLPGPARQAAAALPLNERVKPTQENRSEDPVAPIPSPQPSPEPAGASTVQDSGGDALEIVQEAAEEHDTQPESPAPAGVIGMTETQVKTWLVENHTPEGMSPSESMAAVNAYFKTGISRQWNKMKPEERELSIQAWTKHLQPFHYKPA